MTCEPCALHAAGNPAAAEPIESIRAQRLLLATLNGNPITIAEIATELHDCHDCTMRLAVVYLTMTATAFTHMAGSADAAATWFEAGFVEDIYNQPEQPPANPRG